MVVGLAPAILAACSGGRVGPAPLVNGVPAQSYPQQAMAVPGRDGISIRKVRKGDTLYSLSREHGVTVRDIIETNRLSAPYQLEPGQRLSIPRPSYHVVEVGDTLYGISRKYGVDSLTLVHLNKIKPPYSIATGQRIKLPAAGSNQTASLDPVPPRSTAAPAAPRPVFRETRHVAAAPDLPSPRKRSKAGFLWPVRGSLLVRFGVRSKGVHNDGINISAPRGAPVRAADNGVVAYAGNEIRGFGKLIMIKHAGGWMSAYAHNSRILVKLGDRVRRGQTISKVGSSGSVSSPQLHFELRRGSRAVDPVKLLNWRTAKR